LGRPGAAHETTPTLAAVAAALPPEGAQFAAWDGPAPLMTTPARRVPRA
jgi:hypothetical protein